MTQFLHNLSASIAVVVDTVATWEGMTLTPHRFGGTEFQLAQREIGHIHRNGLVDIPFHPSIKAQLIAEGRAQPHHFLPESGWISFYMRSAADEEAAIWLLQLGYLYTALTLRKQHRAPLDDVTLRQWLAELHPSPALAAILHRLGI